MDCAAFLRLRQLLQLLPLLCDGGALLCYSPADCAARDRALLRAGCLAEEVPPAVRLRDQDGIGRQLLARPVQSDRVRNDPRQRRHRAGRQGQGHLDDGLLRHSVAVLDVRVQVLLLADVRRRLQVLQQRKSE